MWWGCGITGGGYGGCRGMSINCSTRLRTMKQRVGRSEFKGGGPQRGQARTGRHGGSGGGDYKSEKKKKKGLMCTK